MYALQIAVMYIRGERLKDDVSTTCTVVLQLALLGSPCVINTIVAAAHNPTGYALRQAASDLDILYGGGVCHRYVSSDWRVAGCGGGGGGGGVSAVVTSCRVPWWGGRGAGGLRFSQTAVAQH